MPFYRKEERKRFRGLYPLLDRAQYMGLTKSIKTAYNIGLKKIDAALNRSKLLFQPTSIQLEPTTKCNLRCKYCISPVWGRRGMDMCFEDFRKIVEQFPYLCEILLQGIGEPLMCRDIYKMIDYCRQKRIMTAITTNGTLLNQENAEKLVDVGVDWVIVSIDAARKETFEEIRRGAVFEQVLDNVKTLSDIRGESIKPRIPVSFTGSRENIHELPEVVRLVKDVGADGVDVWGMHFWADSQLKESNKQYRLDHNLEEVKEIILEAKETAEELGVTFSILGRRDIEGLGFEEDGRLHADQLLCQKVYKSCFVSVDGYVTTCADAPDPEKMNFGNLLKEDFKTIWNGKKYVALREAKMRGLIPEQCRTCTGPHVVR